MAKEIILHFGEKYELDGNRTHLLLSELESTHQKTKLVIKDKELRDKSLKKRSQRIARFIDKNQLMIVFMCIKYINQDRDLAKLLVLSKDGY